MAAVALVAYLAGAFGLPLPAAAPVKDRSVPYPCMDNPCGCTCAEDCWRHCCCTTPDERWAWARAHNVQPPAYAERPTADPDGTGGAKSEPACPHCRHLEAGKDAPAAARLPGVFTLSALHCKGLSTLWAGAGVTTVSLAFTWRPAVVLADDLTDADQSAAPLSRTPTPPPPR
jgi:hypothetical protein